MAIVIGLIVVAVFAPCIAPYDPVHVALNEQFSPPSLAASLRDRRVWPRPVEPGDLRRTHLAADWLDPLGDRDVDRLGVGRDRRFLPAAGPTRFIMRLADVVLAFPSIILAMVVTYILGASLFTLFIALSVVSWASAARVVRAQGALAARTGFCDCRRVRWAPAIDGSCSGTSSPTAWRRSWCCSR